MKQPEQQTSRTVLSDGITYTEKEQKGIEKVAQMSRFFDKILLPTIGVLLIITLLLHISGRLREKYSGGSPGAGTSAAQATQENGVCATRNALLATYTSHASGFAACGYAVMPDATQDLALCRKIDDEMTVYQFADGKLGTFTILRYAPLPERQALYETLSLTVTSEADIRVMVGHDGQKTSVRFTAAGFSAAAAEDAAAYRDVMRYTSPEELQSMMEIFETDIRMLADVCGGSQNASGS